MQDYDFAGLVKEVEETIAEMDSIREQYEKVELYCSSYHTFKSRLETQEFINCLDYILYKHGLPSFWGSYKDVVRPSQV